MKQEHTFPQDPIEIQVGGDHYKKYALEPIEFCEVAELTFIQGSIAKYVVRHKDKNGVDDLKKAKHFCDLGTKYEGLNTQYVAPGWKKAAVVTFCRVNNMERYVRLFTTVIDRRYHDAARIISDMITMWDAKAPKGGING